MMQLHAQGDHLSPELTGSTAQTVREVSPKEAWQALKSQKAILVDVRTEQELPDYGKPDLSSIGGESYLIPWRLAPDFEANPHFVEQLKSKIPSDTPLYFMCKLGGRSYEATSEAQKSGFSECYNIIGGMDGEQGWKASGLAWEGK